VHEPQFGVDGWGFEWRQVTKGKDANDVGALAYLLHM
jgi:hypothetical protein